MELAVEVVDLTKVYLPSPRWMRFLLRSAISQPVTALRGISFTLRPGEVCAIVGPNGAGKSTLFRVLTGLTTPSSGIARIHGLDATSAPRSVRSLVGFVPAGDQSLQLRLSCTDNLLFHGRLAGLRSQYLRSRIDEVLEIVGLGEAANRVGFALSAGMRARLQLARAMLHRPRLLILDEPTAAVDPVGAYELLQDLQKVAAEDGVATLISSHRLEEIEALHHRVVLMDSGTIAFDGDLDTVSRLVEHRKIKLRFVSADQCALAEARLCQVPGIDLLEDGERGPNELTAATDVPIGTIVGHLDGMLDVLLGIEETRLPLREVIYSLLKERATRSDLEGPNG
jgi:ABC-2 type transport system ATP-binding protein